MNARVLSLLQVRVLATALAVIGAAALSFMIASPALAGAPTMTGVASDQDGNGTIDRIVVTFNEAANIDDASGSANGLTSIALGAGCTIANGAYASASTTTLTLSGLTGCTAGDTSITPSVTYTSVASCATDMSICDAAEANQMANAQTTNATDAAAPQIKTFTYSDADGDGKIDTILLTYTETTSAASTLKAQQLSLTGVGDFTALAFGAATTDVADGGTTDTITLGTESTVQDTAEGAGTIAISTITGDGTMILTDGTTTNISAKAQSQATFVDGAKPVIKTFTYSDADTDALIDTIVAAYTETVTAASVLKMQDLILTGVGDFTALAFGTATTDLITGSVSSTTMTMGTESSAQDTNEAAGTIAITSQNTFSLTDGTNTNATLGVQSVSAAFVDAARPMLLTTSPAQGAVDVSRSASIVFTFSEPITGDATWTHTGGPVFASFTETGTNVLTLAHSDLFSSGYHSVDMTVAADALSNTYNGAVAAISDPFTFTVASSSSSSSSTTTTAATYDIDVTAPNGGETLTAGEAYDITWSAETTGSSMSAININLSYTEDGSTVQETIVTGTANDGSYSWTVPTGVDTDTALIQVVGTDLVEALATDESDEYFTIGTATTSGSDDEDTTDDDSDDVTAPSSGTTGLSPVTGELEDISVVADGDYVRSPYFDTVYYVEEDADGTLVRRPFLDAQTFMTWQNSWNVVDTVTDATLPTLELGNPMLPKSGVVLIKIQSDARVFAVEADGLIRWVPSESLAISLYGSNWADYVIDVPATLFPHFEEGDDIGSADDVDTSDMKTRAEVNS